MGCLTRSPGKIPGASSHTTVSSPSPWPDFNTSPPQLLCFLTSLTHLGSRRPRRHHRDVFYATRQGRGLASPAGGGELLEVFCSPWPAGPWRIPGRLLQQEIGSNYDDGRLGIREASLPSHIQPASLSTQIQMTLVSGTSRHL